MKAVIIDDGVYEGFMAIPYITQRWIVNDACKIVKDSSVPFNSHGTNCAHIIKELAVESQFVSIKVLDKNGQGRLEKLIVALQYCLQNRVKLIHMSLGTSNYHDFANVSKVVRDLTGAGTIIVAAFNNFGTLTMPACLPAVFGVIADRNPKAEPYSLYVEPPNDFSHENVLVVAKGKNDFHMANSLAAPVVTGKIYAYLIQKPEASFEETLGFLTTQITLKLQNKSYFFNYEKYSEKEVPIPIIYVAASLLAVFSTRLTVEGYQVENFVDYRSDSENIQSNYKNHKNKLKEVIPLSYYSNGELTKGLIAVLYEIYKPDVFLFSTECYENMKIFDISVYQEEKGLRIKTGETSCFCKCFKEAYAYIIRYFSGIT